MRLRTRGHQFELPAVKYEYYSTNETLLFDRFLIMYDLCVFVCIKLLFTYLLTYLLRGTDKRTHGQSERLMPPASIYISNRTGKTGTKIRCPFERGLALRPKSQTTSLQSLF